MKAAFIILLLVIIGTGCLTRNDQVLNGGIVLIRQAGKSEVITPSPPATTPPPTTAPNSTQALTNSTFINMSNFK